MTSSPSDTFAEKISNLLQENWDTTSIGLQSADVAWSHDKFETLNSIEQISQKAIISTYNPQNPVTEEQLSRETKWVAETVVVDVILHSIPLGGTDATIATREKIRKFVKTVIHQNWNLLPGADQMKIDGEYVRGELPMLQRESFKVVVGNFEVNSV
jgi:hypothetical protein